MSTFVTTGFVLGVRPWREGDRLYTLFTEASGKIEAVAAGSRKVASKLAPHLAPFCEVQFMLARGRVRDRLASANLLEPYLKPPYDLATLTLASTLLEVANALTRLGEPERRLIELLRQSLKELKNLPNDLVDWRAPARWLLTNYLVAALNSTGLAVTLTQCEQCRGALVEPTSFSWTSHGFFHTAHLLPGDTATPLTADTLNWLIKATVSGVNQQDALPSAVLGFLIDYMRGHTGSELYTLKVLRSIL
jgi:DNA repair protein RecO